MVNLRILLGLVPKTAEYEAKMDDLRKEFQELKTFASSKELAEFQELEKTVTSTEFEKRKKQISSQRYTDTDEYNKEKEYARLKKQKEIKRFYQVRNSVELKDFLEFDKSFDVKHYHTLEKLIHSEEFIQQRKKLGKRRFKETPEYEKLIEFQGLRKSKRFREYFAFKSSKDYVNFTLLIGSEKIAAFERLEQFIQSTEFKKVKEYMLLPGKKKYELSSEFEAENKYKQQKNSEKISWYFNVKDSPKFNEIKRWHITFAEDFSEGLNKKNWITRYYWGDILLKDTYALADEKHQFTDGNLEVAHGKLKIITKREKKSGKVWNPKLGFFSKEFNYTSGLVSSAASFRQQYGLFEAKIKFNHSYPVNHAFWMVSEQMLPHIDVVKCAKKMNFGNYWALDGTRVGKSRSSVRAGKYTSDYFIYSLEWSKQKLIWKINGIPVFTRYQGIPDSAMYINFSSGLYTEADGNILPASMEIDWIRCYQFA
jgi:hypothetical protein